jgi:hypothetical protein
MYWRVEIERIEIERMIKMIRMTEMIRMILLLWEMIE